MNQFSPKLDPKTGRFLPVEKGKKPPKMLYMEKVLGVKFEEDYKINYLESDNGQKVFARKWNVNKNLIFGNNLRGGRRSWIQILSLKKKKQLDSSIGSITKVTKEACELCGKTDISFDKAHWIENKFNGSTKSENILNLCPNCHRRIDRGDLTLIEKARETLLFRVVTKILKNKVTSVTPKKLVSVCRDILSARS